MDIYMKFHRVWLGRNVKLKKKHLVFPLQCPKSFQLIQIYWAIFVFGSTQWLRKFNKSTCKWLKVDKPLNTLYVCILTIEFWFVIWLDRETSGKWQSNTFSSWYRHHTIIQSLVIIILNLLQYQIRFYFTYKNQCYNVTDSSHTVAELALNNNHSLTHTCIVLHLIYVYILYSTIRTASAV